MAYSKQTWATGDVVTAAKMNHIEDGIEAAEEYADSVGVLLVVESDGTLSKTWTQIANSNLAVIKIPTTTGFNWVTISDVDVSNGSYRVQTLFSTYTADSATGYPVAVTGGVV